MTSIEKPRKGCQGPGQTGIGEGTFDWQTIWEVLIHEDERPSWSLFISCTNLQVGDLKAE